MTISALRQHARAFADALPRPSPLDDPKRARAFWLVLLALVTDDTSRAAALTDDLVIAIYATALAIDLIEDASAFPAPGRTDPRAAFAAHSTGRIGAGASLPTAAGVGAIPRTGPTSQSKWDGEPVGARLRGAA